MGYDSSDEETYSFDQYSGNESDESLGKILFSKIIQLKIIFRIIKLQIFY